MEVDGSRRVFCSLLRGTGRHLRCGLTSYREVFCCKLLLFRRILAGTNQLPIAKELVE
jgi:hypothetical protein